MRVRRLNCHLCGGAYDGRNKSDPRPGHAQMYCSRECQWASLRTTDLSCKVYFPSCLGCGNVFSAWMPITQWCSQACYQRARYRARRELVVYPVRICRYCAESFQTRHAASIYCSKACVKGSSRERKRYGYNLLDTTEMPTAFIEVVKLYRVANREVQRIYGNSRASQQPVLTQ